jgi:NAD(P)-dependent dehydrogenase (short-subunit alcohol dehydrogenase family)
MTLAIDPAVKLDTDLTGRVALVTGASSGLGWRFAQVLAACGARVAIAARRTDRLDELADLIRKAGGTVLAIELDVSDVTAAGPAFDRIEAELGPVDILINNAGVNAAGWASRMSLEQIDQGIDTNFRGPWVLSAEFAKRAIARKAEAGWIVNIASIGAFFYSGTMAGSLYSVTKSAMVRMTEVLAKEWAPYFINVNCIAPGTIASEMVQGMIDRRGEDFIQAFPRKRMGYPDDLDSTLLFLVSPSSRFVTGTVIKADDGQLPR